MKAFGIVRLYDEVERQSERLIKDSEKEWELLGIMFNFDQIVEAFSNINFRKNSTK